MSRELPGGRERGSITIFFVLFALVMIGVVSYSVYVARIVDEKIKVETTADVASLAMASHAAQGLNMIATNNLATAANLHIAASITFVGRYYAVARAFLSNLGDLPALIQLFFPSEADKTDYAAGFRATALVNGHFTKTAAGLTTINRQLGSKWLYGAPVKGLEQARMNMPGSVLMPLQISRVSAGSPEALYAFRYERLAQATAEKTMCHTIKSSEVMPEEKREAVSVWVGALYESLANPSLVLDAVRDVESIFLKIKGVPRAIIDWHDGFRRKCSVFRPFDCLAAAATKPVADVIRRIPLPRFEGCGLPDEDSGNYGKQLEAFASASFDGGTPEKNGIGFVVPQVDGTTAKAFEESLQFAAVVGRPLYLKEELPRETVEGVERTKCPAEWVQTVNDRQVCSLVVDGIDFGTAGSRGAASGFDTGVGGVSRATGDNAGHPGRLRSAWSRVQWAVAQAKAEYEPDVAGCGTIATCDPAGADHRTVDPANRDEVASKRRMQLFWPAWRARNAEPTVLEAALSLLGG